MNRYGGSQSRVKTAPSFARQDSRGRLSLRVYFWAASSRASLDPAGEGTRPYVAVFGPETNGFPAIRYRSGSFAALVIPIRVVVAIRAGRYPSSPIHKSDFALVISLSLSRSRVMPRASASLPGSPVSRGRHRLTRPECREA